MAVLAEYRDVGRPGYAVESFARGLDQGQSFVERKQMMALRQQRADQEKMEFIAKLPLIRAQTTLTTLNAEAAVKNATTITNLESKAALESVQANKEFLDAIQYNDNYTGSVTDTQEEASQAYEQSKYDTQATLNERSQRLAALSAKYSYMSNLPQYKGFVDTLNKEATQAHLAAASNLKLEELMNKAQIQADQSRYGADQRFAGTVYGADARTTQTGMRDNTRLQVEDTRAKNRLDVVQRQGMNQVQKEGNIVENLSSRAVAADQDAADASAAGDEAAATVFRQNAAALRDSITKRSTYAGTSPSEPKPKGAPVPRKPAPADTTPPASVSISIPGAKLYVVDEQSQTPQLAPSVKTPKDIITAYQQMIDDGVLSPDEARAALTKLGFGHKK